MKGIVISTMVVWSVLVAYIAGWHKVDKEEKFIVDQLESQMMDIEQGKLAIIKGSNEPMHLYGEWMVKDHTVMKEELQALAIERNIKVPTRISNDKAETLTRLRNMEGADFDQEFIRMMRIDHRRDIQELKMASHSTDKGVKAFAQKYLPLLQSHLSGLEELPAGGMTKSDSR
jgi:putative membrane protein